jgi:hypothetical protein
VTAEMDAALTEMASRRLTGMRQRHREQTALRILTDTGQVTTEQVDAQVAATWVDPDPQQLRHAVAAKAAAAVATHETEVQAAIDARNKAAGKVAKYEVLLAHARVDAAAAADSTDVDDARARLAAAQALAAYATTLGNPSLAPASTSVQVFPPAAEAAAAAQGGA